MLNWAHAKGVQEPGKRSQNAYIESFKGRFREECLNEHWFTSLAHACLIVEAWRREYNEERPKKALGELPPATYAQWLMQKPAKLIPGIQGPVLLKTRGRRSRIGLSTNA